MCKHLANFTLELLIVVENKDEVNGDFQTALCTALANEEFVSSSDEFKLLTNSSFVTNLVIVAYFLHIYLCDGMLSI